MTLEQQFEAGARLLNGSRHVARNLRRLAAAHGQKALHDAVLKRMKTYHHQPPANFQDLFRLMQGINQFFQFRIHVNAQCLKCPRRRMGPQEFGMWL